MGVLTFTHSSMREWLASIKGTKTAQYCSTGFGGGGRPQHAFVGNVLFPKAMDRALNGASDSECRAARKLADKIDSSFRDREVSAWVPSVCGAYPIVPDYLIGMPENMRARRPVESDISPIKFVIEPTISQGVTIDQLNNRAAAIAALIMRTNEERPVELWFSMVNDPGGNGDVYNFIRMESTPVSLAHIVAAMTAPTVRELCMSGATYQRGLRHYDGDNHMPGRAQTRRYMGLNPQDVLIQGGHLVDAALMERDPVQWVHRQLEKQREAVDA